MTDTAARDKLITRHYMAGKRLIDIARLFGMKSECNIRRIARQQGAPPRKEGRPRREAN